MAEESNSGNRKGPATRYGVLVFLAGVAVCALFFSLGFLVGFTERSSKAGPSTERVTGPALVPPTLNPPPHETHPAVEAPASAPTYSSAPPSLAQGSSGLAPTTKPTTSAASAPAPTPCQPSPGTEGSTGEPEVEILRPPSDEVRAGFTVQVSASRTRQDAEALVKILKDRGYPVFLVTPEYASVNDNLFRVQVGPFRTRDEAEKVRAKLAKEGLFKDLFIKH